MWFKLLNEDGDYIDKMTKERKNLLSAINWVATPEGLNIGWTELNSLDEALIYFNIELMTIEQYKILVEDRMKIMFDNKILILQTMIDNVLLSQI